jgi:hypothetical protein
MKSPRAYPELRGVLLYETSASQKVTDMEKDRDNMPVQQQYNSNHYTCSGTPLPSPPRIATVLRTNERSQTLHFHWHGLGCSANGAMDGSTIGGTRIRHRAAQLPLWGNCSQSGTWLPAKGWQARSIPTLVGKTG